MENKPCLQIEEYISNNFSGRYIKNIKEEC